MSEQDDWEAWAHECEARIAELEAENRKAVYGCCEECGIVRDLEQAEAALAQRDRMLRLAWTETVQAESYYWKYHDNVDEWLADLRARAEEAKP